MVGVSFSFTLLVKSFYSLLPQFQGNYTIVDIEWGFYIHRSGTLWNLASAGCTVSTCQTDVKNPVITYPEFLRFVRLTRPNGQNLAGFNVTDILRLFPRFGIFDSLLTKFSVI
jgi:hypothetical protein